MSVLREHSRKPDEVRDRIVELMGDIPRIELFARQQVDGWDCWGDEVTGRKTISVYKVKAIRVELFGLFIEWDIVEGFVWQSLAGINAGEIGKTVFLTREEAEKALEAMKNG